MLKRLQQSNKPSTSTPINFSNKYTPLLVAIEQGQWDKVCELCVTHKADAALWYVEYRNPDLKTQIKWKILPLHVAARSKGVTIEAITSLLRAYPQGVKEPDMDGMLPLHWACWSKAMKPIVEALLDDYRDAARIKDNFGRLPLHIACEYGISSENVLMMLRKANPSAINVADGRKKKPVELVNLNDRVNLVLFKSLLDEEDRIAGTRKEGRGLNRPSLQGTAISSRADSPLTTFSKEEEMFKVNTNNRTGSGKNVFEETKTKDPLPVIESSTTTRPILNSAVISSSNKPSTEESKVNIVNKNGADDEYYSAVNNLNDFLQSLRSSSDFPEPPSRRLSGKSRESYQKPELEDVLSFNDGDTPKLKSAKTPSSSPQKRKSSLLPPTYEDKTFKEEVKEELETDPLHDKRQSAISTLSGSLASLKQHDAQQETSLEVSQLGTPNSKVSSAKQSVALSVAEEDNPSGSRKNNSKQSKQSITEATDIPVPPESPQNSTNNNKTNTPMLSIDEKIAAGETELVSELVRSIQVDDWERAIKCIQINRADAGKWHLTSSLLDDPIRWLPLHEACNRKPLKNVVEYLILVFPSAVSTTDAKGRLPIHLACAAGNNVEVIKVLVQAYPFSIFDKDATGLVPLDCAKQNSDKYTSPEEMNEVVSVLNQYYRTFQPIDTLGKDDHIKTMTKPREQVEVEEEPKKEMVNHEPDLDDGENDLKTPLLREARDRGISKAVKSKHHHNNVDEEVGRDGTLTGEELEIKNDEDMMSAISDPEYYEVRDQHHRSSSHVNSHRQNSDGGYITGEMPRRRSACSRFLICTFVFCVILGAIAGTGYFVFHINPFDDNKEDDDANGNNSGDPLLPDRRIERPQSFPIPQEMLYNMGKSKVNLKTFGFEPLATKEA